VTTVINPGLRFREFIRRLLRAGRRVQASPQEALPPADPYGPARESWNEKNHDAAIGILDQILAAMPTDVTALVMKGQVLLSSGRAREARDPLIKALDLDPENLGALETLAYAEGSLSEHERALACWRRIAARKGPDENVARMIGNELVMKGQALLSSDRAREARDPLIEALDLDPGNLGALETLAYAEGALNEHKRALACWRQIAARKGLDENVARMIGNETWARDEQRRNSSAFKDPEQDCPPIEQCLSEIATLTVSNGEGSPPYQELIERLCYQLAAQRVVLGRLENMENGYEYGQTLLRFRNMGVHSYHDDHLKAPPDPPAQIPEPLRNAFSMGGVVELLQGYTNSALPSGCGESMTTPSERSWPSIRKVWRRAQGSKRRNSWRDLLHFGTQRQEEYFLV
jgi:tetratricopeptide (TPR) repeat protein